MTLRPSHRTIRLACVLALVGLAFMLWPLVDPSPIAIVVAMSVGQLVGTVSLGLYLAVIVSDLVRHKVVSTRHDDAVFMTDPPEAPKERRTEEHDR